MKKTEYKVIARTVNGYPVYRVVWVDDNGNYFTKDEGKIWNINHLKNDFILR
jgi:hypothetical protein